MEELGEVSKVFPQDRVQQCFTEQTTKTLATLLAEKIIEVLVIRTQEKVQQLVNTHVHNVVNTVQVEKPKFIQGDSAEKEIIQETINQLTKHIDVPQVQVVAETAEIPQLWTVEKIAEILQIHLSVKWHRRDIWK